MVRTSEKPALHPHRESPLWQFFPDFEILFERELDPGIVGVFRPSSSIGMKFVTSTSNIYIKLAIALKCKTQNLSKKYSREILRLTDLKTNMKSDKFIV